MPAPTYTQMTTLTFAGNGLQAESMEERILSALSILASGQNPDGSPNAGGGGGASFPLTNTAPTAATIEYHTNVTGDTQDRFRIQADGTLLWGPGNAAPAAFLNSIPGQITLSPTGVGNSLGVCTNGGAIVLTSGNNNFPLSLSSQASTAATPLLTVDAWFNGGDIRPTSGAMATTATVGFWWMRTCAGPPTGVPTAVAGSVPYVYDTTTHKFWVYDAGWKGVVLA